MQIPPLFQKYFEPPPPRNKILDTPLKKGLWWSMRWIWLKRIYKCLCVETDQKRRGWDFFARDWDFSGCGWYLVRVVEIVSVMVKMFLGEKIKKFSGKLRFFGKGSNYFWSGLDVFGNGLDFFVWLRFLRDGLRTEYIELSFFKELKLFFMGIEIYFSGSRTWDIFKVINFFHVGELKFPQVGFKFFRIFSRGKCLRFLQLS